MGLRNRIKDEAAKTYVHLPSKIRRKTDPLIPSTRKAKKKAGGFIERRSVKGRKQVMALANRITFGKMPKRNKRRNKR